VWSSAMLGGILISDLSTACIDLESKISPAELSKIFKEVRDSAYKIIEKKGETSYGIGLALGSITKAIVNDENTILPVSTLIQDYYEVDNVFLSLPSIINSSGVEKTLKIRLTPQEQKEFKTSAEKMKRIIDTLDL